MKPRYLDKRNCHALLPSGHGLSMLQRLDHCLCEINDQPGPYRGLIDTLVNQNKRSLGKSHGSDRLVNAQLDIAQGLLVAEKAINTEVRERPYPGPLQLHTVIEYEGGNSWKTLVPLQYLLKGWGDANAGHQCYVHSISQNLPRVARIDEFLAHQMDDTDTHYYVGITSRNWLQRLGEHIAETRRGSGRLFYKTLRESVGWQGVLYTSSLREINQSYDEAMNWEEEYVDKIAADQYGMNMIPGGFKGLKYLHKLGLTKKVRVSLEVRDRAISAYVKANPRKGIPNPFIKEWWKDDEHYEQINASHPKRLSVDQREEIRRLQAEGISTAQIAESVGALNARQVENFLSGKTYKRGAG